MLDHTSESPQGTPTQRRPAAGCTIIAGNYLALANALARSFFEHQPGANFYILVVDGLPEGAEVAPGALVLGPEQLAMPDFYELCFKYDVTELCTAVKPSLLSRLIEDYGEESVIYFDPDILIMRPLDELRLALDQHEIVLIPHLLDPIPLDGLRPSEQDILIAGAYNLGFIALRSSDEVRAFLAWWIERLQDLCRIDPARGLFTDQKWIDLVPGLFPSTFILRDPTYDVAYWNLHTRALGKDGDRYLVDGRPLAFFHFSGFDPRNQRKLSKHQNRIQVERGTPLAELLDHYADLLDAAGHGVSSKWRYGFAELDNGAPVSSILRQLYLGLDPQQRAAFANPFAADSAQSFFDWATRPPADGSLSQFLAGLYHVRTDVAAVFPDVNGRDRDGFLKWARSTGAREMGYAPRMVRDQRDDKDAMVNESATALLPAMPSTTGVAGAGVNVIGYLRNETGIGAVARGYIGALRRASMPVALKDLSELSPNRSEDPTLMHFDAHHPYGINLVCVNADQHFVVASHVGENFFSNRYNIGVWFWELPSFPEEWLDRFAHYDEIWAATSFISNTLGPISPIPVVRMPPVLTGASTGSRERGRLKLRLPNEDDFVFTFIFDFRSYFERKNPLALVEAFKKAFHPDERVRLVIKCVNEQFEPDGAREMTRLAEGFPISIEYGYWSASEIRDLVAASDAYVSLHRSEGLGLPLADAMYLGKPVIATGWSGNMDFMNVANSFPVRYSLTELDHDVGPYRAGSIWAEPSVEHAAELMREVYSRSPDVATRTLAARADIEAHFSVAAVAEVVQARLAAIQARRPQPATPAPVVQPTSVDLLAPRYRRAPIVPAMDLHSSIYGWPGRVVKRAVSFLLSYHTQYQQQLNTTFSSFMRELEQGQDRHAERIDQLAAQLAHLQVTLDEARTDVERVAASAADATARADAATARADTATARADTAMARADDAQASARRTRDRADAAEQAAHEATERATALRQEAVERIDQRADALSTRLDATDQSVAQVGAQLNTSTDQLAALHAAHQAQNEQIAQVDAETDRLKQRLATRPYMAEDRFGALADHDRPMGYRRTALDGTNGPPARFDQLFRGAESFIAERQRPYLQFFKGMRSVVDLGCGRGEFLRLLAEQGTPSIGVEQDADLVHAAEQRELHVVHGDAVEYLRDVPLHSLDGIFAAQFIEHLPPDKLVELLRLASKGLRPGGVLVAETVNPENYEALKTFYVDLTHQKPIYPQVLLHLCEEAGFSEARIFYPLGGGFTQRDYDAVGEYAVVAVR